VEERTQQLWESPLGLLSLVADSQSLLEIKRVPSTPKTASFDPREAKNPVLRETIRQLQDYFTKKRTHFDLPLKLAGTHFQMEVWNTLLRIPYGATWSYQDLAKALRRPQATRAVGSALGKNPLLVVLPCHRVIGSDGSLKGYAGGREAKMALLKIEGLGLGRPVPNQA
jgi:methylated-DNA-[protein]-cysteine S-methyltransferase